jgi:hypothetical protein
VEALLSGLYGGILLCQKIVTTGVTILEKQIIVRSGPFRYLFIPPSPDTLFFTTTPLSSPLSTGVNSGAATVGGGASQPIIHLANFINDALNMVRFTIRARFTLRLLFPFRVHLRPLLQKASLLCCVA